MAKECAHDLSFSNNQYIAVLHKDTDHQHIHIVANRVGYDGKTVSDSNNYQKIAKLCRRLEIKHELKQVLSPNKFLPRELRNYQRLDERKVKLKEQIRQSLTSSRNYEQFEQKMKALNYDVIKMRGIAFRDQHKVYTKGSEVGYSLAKIEKVLAQRQALEHTHGMTQTKTYPQRDPGNHLHMERGSHVTKDNQAMLHDLLKPVPGSGEAINPSLLAEEKKRKRKHKHRHL